MLIQWAEVPEVTLRTHWLVSATCLLPILRRCYRINAFLLQNQQDITTNSSNAKTSCMLDCSQREKMTETRRTKQAAGDKQVVNRQSKCNPDSTSDMPTTLHNQHTYSTVSNMSTYTPSSLIHIHNISWAVVHRKPQCNKMEYTHTTV